MEPARSIIELLGGDTAVARVLDIHRTRVAAWKRAKPGGTGGVIPFRHAAKLIAYAERHNIGLTPDDFFAQPKRVAS